VSKARGDGGVGWARSRVRGGCCTSSAPLCKATHPAGLPEPSVCSSAAAPAPTAACCSSRAHAHMRSTKPLPAPSLLWPQVHAERPRREDAHEAHRARGDGRGGGRAHVGVCGGAGRVGGERGGACVLCAGSDACFAERLYAVACGPAGQVK